MKYFSANILNRFLWENFHHGEIATILTLHRVYPFKNDALLLNEGIRISPEFLKNFIFALQKNGYEFISLDRLYEIICNKEKVKKKIVFTLDDGYKDNFTYAYPIFKKYKIPFTIYVTTSFPEKRAILWWYILEDLVKKNDQLYLSNGQVYECKEENQKKSAFKDIRKIILSLTNTGLLENLNKLFKDYKIDWYKQCNELALTWEQIKDLSNDSLCTIGAHTSNHLSLNLLSKEEIIIEVLESKKLLEQKIEKKIEHFAYPFGGRNEIGKRECDMLKEFQFKTATTTRRGNIFLKHIDHLECLPRVYLEENLKIKKLRRLKKKIITL